MGWDRVKNGEKVDLRKKSFLKDPETDRVYSFTPDELKCWDLYKSGKSKREAYIAVFKRLDKRPDHIFGRKKFKILRKMEEEKSENLWERYRKLAPEALDVQERLMRGKKTKDELKHTIASEIQNRAGYSYVVKNASLRLNVNVENPLALKSSDELLKLFEETSIAIKKLESRIGKTNKQLPVIEGE